MVMWNTCSNRYHCDAEKQLHPWMGTSPPALYCGIRKVSSALQWYQRRCYSSIMLLNVFGHDTWCTRMVIAIWKWFAGSAFASPNVKIMWRGALANVHPLFHESSSTACIGMSNIFQSSWISNYFEIHQNASVQNVSTNAIQGTSM